MSLKTLSVTRQKSESMGPAAGGAPSMHHKGCERILGVTRAEAGPAFKGCAPGVTKRVRAAGYLAWQARSRCDWIESVRNRPAPGDSKKREATIMKRLRGLMLALPVIAASGTGNAQSVSGNYLITLATTHPSASLDRYCLSLNDDGSVLGFAHGGQALIGGYIPGEFYIAGHTLVATIGFHGVTFVLNAPLHGATAGPASFTAVYDGAIAASGRVTAAARGSCTPA
jgi:hypothetical protein